MRNELKILILKITFSPIWFIFALCYVVIETWVRFTNPTAEYEEFDIWEYWRLQMWQKIKCWLGWHDWVLTHETVETRRLGYQQIFWYECKHCGKVKK